MRCLQWMESMNTVATWGGSKEKQGAKRRQRYKSCLVNCVGDYLYFGKQKAWQKRDIKPC